MAKGSVGCSVANVSIGSCLRSTLINIRQPQSHPNINLGQYRQPFYQPKPSQTPLTEFQKIQNFQFFWNRSSDCDPPRLNWQLQPRPMGLIFLGLCMDRLFWANWWHNKMCKMRSAFCRCRSVPIIISGQGKMVCWLVGGKCVKGSCPRSTLINNRQSQSHPNINLGQYKQLFYQPKPSQTPLTEVQKSKILTFFEIGQVTLTPRGSIGNFKLGLWD